uniref:RING-type domain-containing protein n=1 Tax=Globodera rostochiensis TaxID=31243 RepID=A0A914H808_GLORO
MKNILLVQLLLFKIAYSICQIIRPYIESGNQIGVPAYHIAQISPPGIYRIIIWSKNSGMLSMLINDKVNLHIIPLNREMPMLRDKYGPNTAAQKVYSMAKKILRRWLFGFAYEELSDKENFFLFAILNNLIDECKKKINGGIKNEDVILLGVFINFLWHKNGQIMKRFRLADERMIGLIGEFCQINHQFMLSHPSLLEQIRSRDLDPSFCDRWPTVHQQSLRYTQSATVLETFHHWLHPQSDAHRLGEEQMSIGDEMSNVDELSDEMRQIVKLWMEIFNERIYSHKNEWPELDLNIFIQIGKMFANAINGGILTMEKLNIVVGIYENLKEICHFFQYFWLDCKHNLQLLLLPWRNVVCINNEFQFIQIGQSSSTNVSQISDSAVTDGHDVVESPNAKTLAKNNGKNILEQHQQQQQPSLKESSSLECVVCCDNKIETVYVPCGHACTCQKCADEVGDKCPICRSDESWPIRIYLL